MGEDKDTVPSSSFEHWHKREDKLGNFLLKGMSTIFKKFLGPSQIYHPNESVSSWNLVILGNMHYKQRQKRLFKHSVAIAFSRPQELEYIIGRKYKVLTDHWYEWSMIIVTLGG